MEGQNQYFGRDGLGQTVYDCPFLSPLLMNILSFFSKQGEDLKKRERRTRVLTHSSQP